MEDPNQTFVSDGFLALYSQRGRPTRERAEIEARYEFCEDLAGQVATLCQTVQFNADLSESAALRTCFDGLAQPPRSVDDAEATWVICRVCELLEWQLPAWLVALAPRPPR